MANNNMHIITGNLTADVELKQTASGKSVASFTLGCNRYTGDEKGTTDFLRVVAWGNLAEKAARNGRKGSAVFVVGTVIPRQYTDAQGNKRALTETVADFLRVLGKEDSQPRIVPQQFEEHVEDDGLLPF